MKAVLLGSGGWIPTTTRETCCLCLRKGPDVLVIDAGTGLRRVFERPELLAGARSVHIVLSHFHLDHVVGLAYLPALGLAEQLVLWGPGEALYEQPTRVTLDRMLASPFFTPGLDTVVADVLDLREGENQCGAFAVTTRRQERHGEPSVAFRVDDLVSYCTDTAFDEENAVFATGSSILFHEAWSADGSHNAGVHTSAAEAGVIARAAAVDRLVLIHVHPLLPSDGLEAAARSEFANVTLGTDLLETDVG